MSALDTTKAEGLTQGLKLLANPNRLRILARLLDGELSVGGIEQALGIRQPSLSRELARLRDGGAITARRESKAVFYALNSPEIEDLLRRVLDLDEPSGAAPRQTRSTIRTDFDPRPKFRFRPQAEHARLEQDVTP